MLTPTLALKKLAVICHKILSGDVVIKFAMFGGTLIRSFIANSLELGEQLLL